MSDAEDQNTPHANTLPTQQAESQNGGEVLTPAVPQRKAALVATTRQPGAGMAIIPQDIEQAYRLASAICAADMAPKSYKRDANAVMVGILHGLEVGFTPMAALQSIAVINGMPSIWGDGALALIEASGLLEDKEERIDIVDGGLVAVCRMKRKGRSWTEQTFSWQDAKIAKLDKKDTYQLYGRRMLQRRARAWCMTDGFADVLRGLHIREAVDDGALVQSASGVYEVANAPAEATPRPTRQAQAAVPKDVQERLRKEGVTQNQSYRDSMAEPTQTGITADATQQDDNAEKDRDPRDNGTPAAKSQADRANEAANQQSKQTAPVSDKHLATERVLRKKLAELKSLRMFKPAFIDYLPELEEMRADEPARHTKLMADIYAAHPELKDIA